jgi:hypothetical protein
MKKLNGEEPPVEVVEPAGAIISLSGLTALVIVVGAVALILMSVLTYQIYASNQPKQRASVESEEDEHAHEIT